MKGKVIAVNQAEVRGIPKRNVALMPPDIMSTLEEGDYSENITIEGIPLKELRIGRRLQIGEAEVLIRHIGKERPKPEGRPYIVSREGRFGTVTKSGTVKKGDLVIPLEGE
jgi:MOSC domain-containing protein YiiM